MDGAVRKWPRAGESGLRDYIELGPAPYRETPAQVGEPDYRANALRECRAYIQAIRNYLGPEPDGAQLGIKAFPHDFGTYYEVICYYDPDRPASVEYAFDCEGRGPATWDEGGVRPPPRASGRRR